MYPTVQAWEEFPIGVPEIYVPPNIPPINTLFGLINCMILPPAFSFLPPLAKNFHGKLMNVLCEYCAEHKITTGCTHTDRQRALVGTWTSVEISLALTCGYRMIEIYEVWHYKQRMKYKKPSKAGDAAEQGLFASFVFTFYALKTQASGLPSDMTQEMISEYCDSFFENTGTTLDPSAITLNEVIRSTSKLILNSLWYAI